jgi:RimJ/RimL family protein N-acetyltransferase
MAVFHGDQDRGVTVPHESTGDVTRAVPRDVPRDVPVLSDGDVTLRAPRPQDAAGVLEQCRDPSSRRWTTVPLDYTYRDAQEYLTHFIPEGWERDSEWGFVVEAVDDHGTPRFAGSISLRNLGVRRAEVAYGAHPWARGRGVMARAVRLLLDWGFAEKGLETVTWWANRGNWASRRLAWRLGFTVEGAPRHWLPHRGELQDAWVGTLLAGDPRTPRTPWYDVPRVVGEHVVLRRHEERDATRVLESCSDPDTWGWIGSIPHPFTLEHAQGWIADREEEHASGRAVTWAVADPGTDDLVGTVVLFGVKPGHEAEVGYWVHPGARGRGVATEAVRLVVRHAFVPPEDGGLGLVRVRAVAAVGNAGSRRVLEKGGLSLRGVERLHYRTGHGELVDAAVHDVLAPDVVKDQWPIPARSVPGVS